MAGDAVSPMPTPFVGQPLRRLEDSRLLRGQASFLDDLRLPDLHHVAFVRSIHPHARFRVDGTTACGVAGVVGIFTASDVCAATGSTVIPPVVTHPALRACQHPLLARDKVRYVGEPVVAVVADGRYAAADGAAAVRVEYDPLTVVPDARMAVRGEVTSRPSTRAPPPRVPPPPALQAPPPHAGSPPEPQARRASHRRLPARLCAQVQALLRDRYAGFNDTHLTEKLREVEGLRISRESVRRLRRGLGLPAAHRRRPPTHRSRRPREQAAGQLVQVDGSPFDWLEGRGPAMTLLGAIDDATSEVLALHFRPTEDLHGYATVLAQMAARAGLPVALYGDGVNILVRTDRHWSLDEELAGAQAPPHLGRVLQELGIGYVQARSPQGKGRVERLWGTLQDRLVSELRVRGIADRAAANAMLPEFLADFNRRFARPAAAPPVWRRPPRDLALVMSCRYQRVVARDHTLRLGPRLIAIPPGPGGRSYAGRRVEVRELLDGRVRVFADGRVIGQLPAPGPDFTLLPRRHPHADRPRRAAPANPLRPALAALQAALTASTPRPGTSVPSAQHPWRTSIIPEARREHPRRG
jgi:hypothetical protein